MDILRSLAVDPNEEIIVIAAAMPQEAEPFQAQMSIDREAQMAGQTWQLGTWQNRRVCLVTTGIGLTNAASAATRAHLIFGPALRAYLCAGTTGGLASNINVKDVVIGTQFVYSRADATAFGYAPGQVPGLPAVFNADPALTQVAESLPASELAIRVGQVSSSDAFVTTETVERTRELFPLALAADMESTAAAQVCAMAGVPFMSVRGVSDLCGPQAGQDFHVDASVAAKASAEAVKLVVRAIE